MTTENFISILADHVLSTVTGEQEFKVDDEINKSDHKKNGLNLTADQSIMYSHYKGEPVIKLLKKRNLIDEGSKFGLHKLSEFGIEIKEEYGSYKKYKEFIKRRENSQLDIVKWTKWVAIFTGLTVVVLILTEIRSCTHEKSLINDTTNKADTSKALEIKR